MCDKARFLVGVLCSVFGQREEGFLIPGIQGRVEEKFFPELCVLCREKKLSENEHQCVGDVPCVLSGGSAVLPECSWSGSMLS